MNWKLFVATMLLVALSVSVFAASTQLINAAKTEGKVVIYSITSRIANAAAAFEKKYGIKVEAYDLHDCKLVEKVSKKLVAVYRRQILLYLKMRVEFLEK